MNFWRWYLGSLKGFIKYYSPFFECVCGIVIGTTLVIMGVAFISLWFLLLIPVAITLVAHAYWRQFRR